MPQRQTGRAADQRELRPILENPQQLRSDMAVILALRFGYGLDPRRNAPGANLLDDPLTFRPRSAAGESEKG